MAAFDPGDDAEEMPESKWADGFQRSADAGWWSKGDHVSLGKDLDPAGPLRVCPMERPGCSVMTASTHERSGFSRQ